MNIVVTESLFQFPYPGKRVCKFCGDTIKFELKTKKPLEGKAFIRTNVGHGRRKSREIIRSAERGEVKFFMDWYDIPLIPYDRYTYYINLPLTEAGNFEAKCYFASSKGDVLWPQGDNTIINVKPPHSIGGNVIYNAFVRLFGPGKHGIDYEREFELSPLDEAGFAVIPPSGRFRDLVKELDFIIYELGCNYIQVLPIFPVPTTFGRMGRFGSPYAVLDFFTVDPALAEFDPHATPIEQFMEFVEEVHKRGGRVILDIPINHTGWGSRLHDVHPDWLKRTREGEIEVPEVWGVRWEDLTRLDYSKKDLWKYMAEVFLTWCSRGVDGFRGDAGYMIPLEVWEYIIAKVRRSFPDTIFFLEGLGGDISKTRDLLCRGGYDWAYSELFQNYTRSQIEPYVLFAREVSSEDGIMIHFCETHDNNRLASVSITYARMRTALCALLSFCGGFGFANGVEWFAREKIDVHRMTSLNWGAKDNQVKEIGRLSHILKYHPCFQGVGNIRFLTQGQGEYLVFEREDDRGEHPILVLVNLDCERSCVVMWREGVISSSDTLYDLLTGEEFSITKEGEICSAHLSPGEVRCLALSLEYLGYGKGKDSCLRDIGYLQVARAILLKIFEFIKGTSNVAFDLEIEARYLLEDPLSFLNQRWRKRGVEVVVWNWPEDIKRDVMLPTSHILLLESPYPFRIQVERRGETIFAGYSLKDLKGRHFAIFFPYNTGIEYFSFLRLKVWVYTPERVERGEGRIVILPLPPEEVRLDYSRRELLKDTQYCFLLTNKRGSMCYIPLAWGEIRSKYHGLLVANVNPTSLDERMVLFPRLRVWVVNQGYYAEVKIDYIQRFFYEAGEYGRWDFYIPTGLGKHIHLSVFVDMDGEENITYIRFYRHIAGEGEETRPVEIVLRPDVDWRSHHYLTKAYEGPEEVWPSSVYPFEKGFEFSPSRGGDTLKIEVNSGRFFPQPHWEYMVHLPLEEERGMECHTDLFSPGYFSSVIEQGEWLQLSASVGPVEEDIVGGVPCSLRTMGDMSLEEVLERAMSQFVVHSGRYVSVVAGYPWFLDWGRDSLIFCRGLIYSSYKKRVKDILAYLGRYEENGTLPNLIKGEIPLNRDTSDAPLWYILLCKELMELGEEEVLDIDIGERSIKEVIFSIASSYVRGTENGIRMDLESSLIYSPAHFTWMDTNYPACTPREGYPIEIQALWFAALEFMETLDPEGIYCPVAGGWSLLRKKVKKSIFDLFYLSEKGYFSDCLHTSSFEEAFRAERDDHLRPNQIFVLTLKAVENPDVRDSVLSWCGKLVLPGAIRSLADRPTEYPANTIPPDVFDDVHYFYRGRYLGDENTHRKLAYHNGTAWSWLFPSFCEAYVYVKGNFSRNAALSLLTSGVLLLKKGCVGQMPEILDGDSPHTQRGCLAQAWSVSEFYRVLRLLKKIGEE